MNLAVTILMYAALTAWLVFVAWYWIRARWWESPTGRNVMGVAMGVASLLALIAANRTWPDYWLRPAFQTLVYGALIILGIQRTWQMEREQRKHDH